MILASSVLCLAALGTPTVKWSAPGLYVGGGALLVHVDIEAPKEGASLASWALEPSAFTVNGKALGERKDASTLKLAPGQKISFDVDLGPIVAESKAFESKDFKLGYAKDHLETKDVDVRFAVPAEKGLDFMKMTPEELAQYHVVLQTNRGNMELEFWPDVAPNHVRNFLDLSYTGFYNGILFHRVSPGFMIQGGDPNTKTMDTGSWGIGRGPRMLAAEFSAKKHVRGVLSMARGAADPNSASSQFFIMHATYPSLDGQYSAFGMLVNGLETLDAIVKAKGTALSAGGDVRPTEPQKILAALVIKSSAKAGGNK